MTYDEQKALVKSLNEGSRLQYTTAETAYFLQLREDTLRGWACFADKGPIKPRKVGNRLAWMATDIRELLGMEAI